VVISLGFRHDTKHLSGQQQEIIRQRDKNGKLVKEQSDKRKLEEQEKKEEK
jgi:hypothetical protein